MNGPELIREQDLLRTIGFHLPSSFSPFFIDSGQSLYSPCQDFWSRPPERIRTQELLADLPLLRRVMEQAYIGWELAAAEGWHWESFFASWSNQLKKEGSKELGVAEAFSAWDRLMAIQLDNHSGPRYSSRQTLSETYWLPNYEHGTIEAVRDGAGHCVTLPPSPTRRQPWQAFMANANGNEFTTVWAMSLPAQQNSSWLAAGCGAAWLKTVPSSALPGDRIRSLAQFQVNGLQEVVYRELNDAVVYLRIPTLTAQTSQLAADLHRQLPPNSFHRRAVVVDLRGNEGGTASGVFDILRGLPGWNEIDVQGCFSIKSKDSPVVDALQWGYIQCHLKGLSGPLPLASRKAFQAALDKAWSSGSAGPKMREFRSARSFRDHRFPWSPNPGVPRICILTDSNCGSDGEFLVYALSMIPGSVIVGTATAGVAQFARPGIFLLPHTKVPFRLASAWIDIHGDGSAFEGLGLKPDILLDLDEPLSPKSLLRLLDQIEAL